jgi:hypothetical protein
MHAFVENEQWNVICMKEEFHANFLTIVQIIYQRKWFAYFNNKIVITFDLTYELVLYNFDLVVG